jgi:hypothetical protein
MAHVFNVERLPPVCPEEYLRDFIEHGDSMDLSCMLEYGGKLGAVVSNKNALIERVNAELGSWRDGFNTMYTQGSMLLAGKRRQNAYLRVNFWPVIPESTPDRAKLELIYSYGIPHDHGFSFLTANYFGPGYVTDIYDYDYEDLIGADGEPVGLAFAQTVKLDDSTGIYFEAGKDVHVQYQPAALTVSVNLMLYNPGDRSRDQFYFDLENKRVTGFAAGALSVRRSELIRIAGVVGDATTTGLLTDIALSYGCRSTRRAALKQLLTGARSDGEEICKRLIDDDDVVVKEMARGYFDRGRFEVAARNR